MTDLPALREAVAETIPYCGQGETVPNAWARRGRAERILLDAVPALLDELEAARDDCEHERLRLAACGVAAMGNTPSMVAERIANGHPYYSASYGDVCAAVDREMALRADLAALKARTLNIARGCHDYGGGHHGDGMMDAYQHGIQTVVNALTAAFQDRPNDFQTATLERLGAEAAKEQA